MNAKQCKTQQYKLKTMNQGKRSSAPLSALTSNHPPVSCPLPFQDLFGCCEDPESLRLYTGVDFVEPCSLLVGSSKARRGDAADARLQRRATFQKLRKLFSSIDVFFFSSFFFIYATDCCSTVPAIVNGSDTNPLCLPSCYCAMLCSRFVRCFEWPRFTTSVQSQLRKFVEASLVETGTSLI